MKHKLLLCSIGIGAIIAAAAMDPAQAHADTHTHDMYLFCEKIASDPTPANVARVLMLAAKEIGDTNLAASVAYDAISQTCPEYYKLVMDVVNSANSSNSVPATAVDPTSRQHDYGPVKT